MLDKIFDFVADIFGLKEKEDKPVSIKSEEPIIGYARNLKCEINKSDDILDDLVNRIEASQKNNKRASGNSDNSSLIDDLTRRINSKKILSKEPRHSLSEQIQDSDDVVNNDLLPKNFTVLPEYEKVLYNLNNSCGNQITFVSGSAGTGKSFLIKWLKTKLDTNKIALLAPTGVAALNIHGSTIHSFCFFKPAIIDFSDYIQNLSYRSKASFKKKVKYIKYIIIDEISMVRCDVLDALDNFFRLFTEKNEPFGGRKVLVIGDLLQLPPVIKDEDEDTLRLLGYNFPYYCFSSHVWNEIRDKMTFIALTKNRRQQSTEFYKHLNAIRLDNANDSTLAYFNTRVDGNSEYYPKLTPYRNTAKEINFIKLNELKTPSISFEGKIKDNFPHNDLPVPLEISLKVGARVMIVKNDSDGRYVNGSSGVITRIFCDEDPNVYDHVEVRLDNDTIVNVGRATWENYAYTYDDEEDKYKYKIVGTYSQIPVILAWAITIHKAQGLTISKMTLSKGPKPMFANGQLYVALSRCRSLDDLKLNEPITKEDVFIQKESLEEYAKLINHN